jgi:hypothetical protein
MVLFPSFIHTFCQISDTFPSIAIKMFRGFFSTTTRTTTKTRTTT